MEIRIYYNARCQKSRSGLQYLKSKNIEPEIVEYLKDKPFTNDSLKKLLTKLNLKPIDIIRTQETDFKTNYKGKTLNDEQWIKILVEKPKLIRRPIIENEEKAVLGDIIKHIDPLL